MPEGSASGAGPRIILGIDFGKRRIGVACGDTVSRSARPLTTLTVSESGVRWNELQALLMEWRPSLVVVGLPYNVDGSESTMTAEARAFAGELKSRFGIDVQLVDERYSSLDAQARLKSRRESGERKRRIAKEDIDAAAASVILERWLNEIQ
jgi:putative Holliday junction resolvase